MTEAPYPLGALLARAHAQYVAECEKRLAAAGFDDLAVAHGSNILRHLSPGNPMRVSELVRLSGITKQAVSQQLAYLTAHDYLAIEPDERDGRAKVARLTPRGAASQQTIRRIFGEVQQEWRERYGDDRLRTVTETLSAITGLEGAR